MCDHRFPVIVGGRNYYVHCTLPANHGEFHEGIVREYGAPAFRKPA